MFGGHRYGSPKTSAAGIMDMRRSIVESSNVYYYTLANEMGVDLIHDQLSPFGFGRRTGIDLEGEVTGVLPSTEWKRKTYKRPEQRKWYAGETISLGIGQGYNNFTMLQIASVRSPHWSPAASASSRAWSTRSRTWCTREKRQPTRQALEPLPLKPEQVDVIRSAMNGVTTAGTSTRVFAGAGYQSGGKTGTAQAVGIRQNEKYAASRKWPSTCATTRSIWPLRPWTSRALRWR